jgi:hypothetical protein
MIWEDEFPSSFRVPWPIEALVMRGILEEMSWRNDPAPSFGARLRDRRWARLWTEHPDPECRKRWPFRFILMIQSDPSSTAGEMLAETDDLAEALRRIEAVLYRHGRTGPSFRFTALLRRPGPWMAPRSGPWEPCGRRGSVAGALLGATWDVAMVAVSVPKSP